MKRNPPLSIFIVLSALTIVTTQLNWAASPPDASVTPQIYSTPDVQKATATPTNPLSASAKRQPTRQMHHLKVILDTLIAAFTAFGTVAVAVLAIWGEFIRSNLAPARLVIQRHEIGPNLTYLTDQHGNPMPSPNRVYFYHLRVVNLRGWLSGRNCRVLLRAMSRRGPDGLFHPVPFAVPLQFVWSPSEVTPPIITIQQEQVLDLGMVHENNPRFVPRLYSYSNNFAGYIGPSEAVRYSLQIVSDTFVSRTYQVFEVAFDGVWSPIPAQMENHLVIREIT